MSALANHAEDLLLTYLLTLSAATRPTAWYVELHFGDPGEDGTSNPVTATEDADYVRKAVTFADPVAGSGQCLSNNAPSWTVGAGTGYTLTHISIWDALSGGNCLYKGSLLVSVPLVETDVQTFTAGYIVATLD